MSIDQPDAPVTLSAVLSITPWQEEEEEELEEFSRDCSIFGNEPLVAKLVDFWGKSLSKDIQSFFTVHCDEFTEDDEHRPVAMAPQPSGLIRGARRL